MSIEIIKMDIARAISNKDLGYLTTVINKMGWSKFREVYPTSVGYNTLVLIPATQEDYEMTGVTGHFEILTEEAFCQYCHNSGDSKCPECGGTC